MTHRSKMIITVDQIISWCPCKEWPRERIAEVVGDGLTPLQICDLDISVEDRLWVLLRPEVIPEKALHLLACDFAGRALNRERAAGREPDQRAWEALRVKRAWVVGEATDAERTAAWSAADAAAYSAAVRSAGWSALAAADAAAWSAADAAAYSAAYAAAARSAAAAAERKWQIEKVREVLK
jgi:hypothetical protein